MTGTATTTPLAANLAHLGDRNADVVAQIQRTPPATGLHFTDSRHGAPTATLDDVSLASRHDPRGEGDRLAGTVDVIENAVVVVLGFGLGYHVEALARRVGKAGLIVVYEPDVALLRAALEHIDHSDWIRSALLVIVTDADDRGALARKLDGAEAMLAQGVSFLEHPPSRRRLDRRSAEFTTTFSGHVTAAKTTFVTTLVRSIDTVRNLLANVDHYVGGPGVADLENVAAGHPAVVVSAGPSLRKNVHLLAEPGVRDRCVIVAVQTTLRPLLDAGIRPHFVTALDYHEISRRFYEGLSPADVEGVTLVAEAKAHPAILDAFPGAVRCCAAPFLDRLLGDGAGDMGRLPSGATVAHLAVYLARWLGCDPVAMIGQDLGFPDGLYYAPGTAIHRVWAPELNPFNTIAMMEWQRIVRFRVHLHKTIDVHGRSIYTDAQMRTYLQQFERDFAAYAEAGVQIIDATEGGVAKQHVRAMPLADVLARHATRPLPVLPAPAPFDEGRTGAATERVTAVHRDVVALRGASRRTAKLLHRMLQSADDGGFARDFAKIERERRRVEERFEAFRLLESLNQLGTFKRLRADRRLHLQESRDDRARQRAQLERDRENVEWIADAANEMAGHLASARRLLRGEVVEFAARPAPRGDGLEIRVKAAPPTRVAALVPVDPERDGRGIERSLAEPWDGANVLQRTLERLGQCDGIESIILLAADGADVDALVDRATIGRPVEVERTAGSPFGPQREAVAAARLWADTCWRGGIGGMSIYDEALCPVPMRDVMNRRKLSAALVAAPDWPYLSVDARTGAPALVARYREQPDQHTVVFTQAPPGLSARLVTTPLMAELAQRTRNATIGGLLVYQPHAPQDDPIGRDGNVQIDHVVRDALVRATADSPRQRRRLRRGLDGVDTNDAAAIVAALERAARTQPDDLPQHVILELTTGRRSRGRFDRLPTSLPARGPLDLAVAERIFAQLGAAGDGVVTFGGTGDPLLHPDFDRLARMARAAGVRGVHVRTALLAEPAELDRLLAAGVDVVSVDLHADRAETYRTMMGVDRFRDVLDNIQHLARHRRTLTGPAGGNGFALPWIVPRLERLAETYEDIDSFFDRWQHLLGAVVIEPPPRFEPTADWPADTLAEAVTPAAVAMREQRRRMTIYSDGSVPVSEMDLAATDAAGNVATAPMKEIWARLVNERERRRTALGPDAPEGRTLRP